MADRTDVVDQSVAGASPAFGIRISRFGHRYARISHNDLVGVEWK